MYLENCVSGEPLFGLEYVRYGIEMKMETHKAIRSQHKTIEETKIIKMM